MILSAILAMSGVAAVASVINLIDKKKSKPVASMPLELKMPGNLPIIALFNNGNVFNFIVDSGSNISHICAECYEHLDSKPIGVYEESEIAGLGGKIEGITMCEAMFSDIANHKYKVNLSISKHLSQVAKNVEEITGVQVHGLLGTDFLREYNYVLDFKALKIYPQK